MIKKTILFVTAVTLIASGALLLGSCLPPDAGGKLMVNNDGYFLDDVIYKINNGSNRTTLTFRSDGSYQRLTERYDTADEEWYDSSGQKGSYSWDPVENMLERELTHYIFDDYWEPYDDNRTQTTPLFFTEHKFYHVYNQDESNKNLFTFEESTDGGDYTSETLIEMKIDADSNKLDSYTKTETRFENDLTSGYEREDSGSFEIFPSGRAFAMGNTANLSGTSEYRSRQYSTGLGEWSDWTEREETFSTGYIHMGSFLLMDNDEYGLIPASFRELAE